MEMSLPIVEIEWLDAAGPDVSTTFDLQDAWEIRPLKMKDVGYLVHEDEECVILSPELSSSGGCRRLICIPIRHILSRKVLGEKNCSGSLGDSSLSYGKFGSSGSPSQ
jgi:hypothetical protein